MIARPFINGRNKPVARPFSVGTQVVEITEAPLKTHSHNPADEAVNQRLDILLTWKSNNQAQAYDVYFGTTTTPPLVSGDQKQRAYVPTLSLTETYYWRVDAKNSIGTTEGDIVSFSTWNAADIWTKDNGEPVTTSTGEYIDITK